MNLKTIILLSFSLLFLFSCGEWELKPIEFIQVELVNVEALSIDSVRVTGLIKDLAQGPARDHGFVWTTQASDPDFFNHEGKLTLGVKTPEEDQQFSAVLKLTLDTEYTFSAYATVDEKEYVYSASSSFRTGQGSVQTLGVHYQRGFSLNVSGRLSGTEKGVFAVQHGFCWSTTNPEPTLADNYINLGDRRDNAIFTFTTVDSLQNETPYYFRAYAILSTNFKEETVYGQTSVFDGNLNFWTQKADFEGGVRYGAVGFSIGQKGYIGAGWGGLASKDFWEYDPQTDTWTKKADFGGGERGAAVGFSIGQKGYIGTGWDERGDFRRDFWEYDPALDKWTQKADFGGEERYSAVGFSIGQKGYIGIGNLKKDFWEYDPALDKWTQKADFGGGIRFLAVGFSIGQKAYVGTGWTSPEASKDFWEYDPALDKWTQKADFGGEERYRAVGFSIGEKGYIGTGRTDVEAGRGELFTVNIDFWEYDPQTNSWTPRADFGGGGRHYALGFSIGDKGYIGTGHFVNSIKDFWEFDP